ncbi:hypothetical protein, partial [Salmonella sp. SAL4359]|uniref:hypothetical protein n=1 Tax=Salmonella sp. SAL4359 TaxID=3159880 RepID=UPI00397E26D3
AEDCIASALDLCGSTWLDSSAVRGAWRRYCEGEGDSSFQIWQWINLGLMARQICGTSSSRAARASIA